MNLLDLKKLLMASIVANNTHKAIKENSETIIKLWRSEKNYSWTQMAAVLGCSTQHVIGLWKGESNLTIMLAARIANDLLI